jgi:AraC-like DNA-binding protein
VHGGDACTSVRLSAASWRRLVGEPGRPRRSTFYVDARLELAHRRLLAAADVDYQLAEDLVALTATALRAVTDGRTPLTDRPAPADARLVHRARAAIHDDHPAAGGLFPLAELLDASPYRLSRAFPKELGVTLTGYRNRVRVGRALDRLQRGDASLAGVAAELGFADQAHFTRVVRRHLGHTPAALRSELRRTAGGAASVS